MMRVVKQVEIARGRIRLHAVSTQPIGVETMERIRRYARWPISNIGHGEEGEYRIMFEVSLVGTGVSPSQALHDFQDLFDAVEAYGNAGHVDTERFPNECSNSVHELIEMSRHSNPHARFFLGKLSGIWSGAINDAVREIEHPSLTIDAHNWGFFALLQKDRIRRRCALLAWIGAHLAGKDETADMLRVTSPLGNSLRQRRRRSRPDERRLRARDSRERKSEGRMPDRLSLEDTHTHDEPIRISDEDLARLDRIEERHARLLRSVFEESIEEEPADDEKEISVDINDFVL